MERVLNSETLKKEFPQIYEDLFTKYPIVTSASRSFLWSGDFSFMADGIVVTQKFPLKTYVGLRPSLNGMFIKKLCFSPLDRTYKLDQFEQSIEKELERQLDIILPICFPGQPHYSYDISIISELPHEFGLLSTGALCASLATAIAIDRKFVTEKDLEDFQSLPSKELVENKKFDTLFRLSWFMETIFFQCMSGGHSSFSSLVNSRFPIVYGVKEYQSHFDQFEDRLNKRASIEQFELIKRVPYFGYRLEEVIQKKLNTTWDIDFGLIHSGVTKNTSLISNGVKFKDIEFKRMLDVVKSRFKQQDIPYFEEINIDKTNFWNNYTHIMTLYALHTLKGLQQLLEGYSTEQDLLYFFKSLNAYQHIISSFDTFSERVANLILKLREEMETPEGYLKMAAKTTGTSQGGDVLFVLPYNEFREEMMDKLANYQKKQKKAFLTYASWRDGYEEKGVHIEQFVQRGIFSTFINPDSVLLKSLDENGIVNTKITTISEAKLMKEQLDIVLDSCSNKVYVKGEKLTSKEIPSQKSTIEIIKILLENYPNEVKNSSFPRSSYSTNKNDFQSKISIPLTRVLGKQVDQPVIQTRGTLGSYYAKIDLKDTSLAIVEDLF